ncbi:adenosine deaminase AGSA-like [Mya arenaria]|uniref:adenosine deaminase AGSA-like n=1 Tax=Mya arenaria TaxID=6604 RepID=UPI0022E5148C|nr:adenosine deaminase AGSA-like [Mya arenaria]
MEYVNFILCVAIVIMARSFGVSFKTVSGGPIFVSEMSMDSVYKGSKFSNDKDYMQKRQLFIDTEAQERVGGEIVMNLDEKALNNRILAMKKKEYDAAHYQGGSFAPQINFLQSKPLYEKSDIFKLIQKMPKGGALHLHDVSITDVNWLVGNVTYRDHCYMCNDVNANDSIVFHFFQNPPSNPGCPWKLVNDVRAKSNNVTAFDQMLLESMVMTPELADADINVIWKAFTGALTRADGLISYRSVFRDYFYEALTEFQADNVQYIELRAVFPGVYELNGTIIAPHDVMQIYKDTIKEFKHDNHDFTGAKIIQTNSRVYNNSYILDDIKTSVEMLAAFPEHFAGYDLVGQEDPGRTLLSYLDELLYPSTLDPPVNLPYFFHAGETITAR